MRIDIDKLNLIVETLYVAVVSRAFGSDGTLALRHLLSMIRTVYVHVDPELTQGTLVIFKPIADSNLIDRYGQPATFRDLTNLCQTYDMHSGNCSLMVQAGNGDYLLWQDVAVDCAELSATGIVYQYARRNESFVVQGADTPVINPCTTFASVFAIPTFGELSDALENYSTRAIRFSSCPIFSECWHSGPRSDRIFFRPGPEETMRNSLTYYLKTVLPDAEVRPEQVVDDSHPVDIKVTWMLTSKLALIEIKWLGKSLNDDGNFVTYTDARAREGAQQLNDYLDGNQQQAPAHTTMGYLVVIDGRRYGLNPASTSVNAANGGHYRNQEIAYNPEFHTLRADFARPIRMFAEPICR